MFKVKHHDPSAVLKCAACHLCIHQSCHLGVMPCTEEARATWMCDSCTLSVAIHKSTGKEDLEGVQCVFCPRRGGYFRPTADAWAHVYCARTAPGQVRISEQGVIDVRQTPKENKKQKCMICNRKSGVCLQCNSLGCSAYFHSICGARSGKAFVRFRRGVQEVYCVDHVPDFIERLDTGQWVDGVEVERLRYCLERGRLIVDQLLKREKMKTKLFKIETEIFSTQFPRVLDRLKGRKSQRVEGVTDENDFDISESESDAYTDDEDEDPSNVVSNVPPRFTVEEAGGAALPLLNTVIKAPMPKKKTGTRRGSRGDHDEAYGEFVQMSELGKKDPPMEFHDFEVVTQEGSELVSVSTTWVSPETGLINVCPRRLTNALAGVENNARDIIPLAPPIGRAQRKDDGRDREKDAFIKRQLEKVVAKKDELRNSTGLFESEVAEIEFSLQEGDVLVRHMMMDNDKFEKQMKKLHKKANDGSPPMEICFQVKVKPKKIPKGKVLVEVDKDEDEDEEDMAGEPSPVVEKAGKGRRRSSASEPPTPMIEAPKRGRGSIAEEEEEDLEPAPKRRGRPRKSFPNVVVDTLLSPDNKGRGSKREMDGAFELAILEDDEEKGEEERRKGRGKKMKKDLTVEPEVLSRSERKEKEKDRKEREEREERENEAKFKSQGKGKDTSKGFEDEIDEEEVPAGMTVREFRTLRRVQQLHDEKQEARFACVKRQEEEAKEREQVTGRKSRGKKGKRGRLAQSTPHSDEDGLSEEEVDDTGKGSDEEVAMVVSSDRRKSRGDGSTHGKGKNRHAVKDEDRDRDRETEIIGKGRDKAGKGKDKDKGAEKKGSLLPWLNKESNSSSDSMVSSSPRPHTPALYPKAPLWNFFGKADLEKCLREGEPLPYFTVLPR